MKNDKTGAEGTMIDERLHQPRPHSGIVARDTKIFLRVSQGPDTGKVFDLSRGGSFIVGRNKGDIPLTDPKVSGRQAELKIFGPDHYYVWDLASTNGTFVNGARVDRRKFGHEDEIRMGDTVLHVSVHEGTLPVSTTGV